MCLFNILHRLRPRLRPIKYRLRNIASYASLQYTASLASTSATATFPILVKFPIYPKQYAKIQVNLFT